jgi:uncharacterized protein
MVRQAALEAAAPGRIGIGVQPASGEILVQRAVHVLSQDHSAVVDAVFAQEAERNAIRDAACRLNVRFAGLFLVAELATRQSRVGHRQRDASDATPEIAGLQEKYDVGKIDWAVIDASGTSERTLQLCRIAVDEPRA